MYVLTKVQKVRRDYLGPLDALMRAEVWTHYIMGYHTFLFLGWYKNCSAS